MKKHHKDLVYSYNNININNKLMDYNKNQLIALMNTEVIVVH